MNIFHAAYIAALVLEAIIRVPYNQRRKQIKVSVNRLTSGDTALLGLLFLGMFLLPVLLIFTPWLNFANYALPGWAGWLGVALLAASVLVFWRAHLDLGRNWTPTLQLLDQHTLVENGLYRWIRHPMYAAQWLWALAQPLLLQNWLAGVVGALVFVPLYLYRVAHEERMMVEQFGEQYQAYMARTGRVLPRYGGRSENQG